MRTFLKDNFLLVLGIGFPVLVILLFVAATKFPLVIEDSPEYGLLFYAQEYQYSPTTEIRLYVEQNQLKAEYRRRREQPQRSHSYVSKLYWYDAEKRKTREISVVPKERADDTYDVWHSFEIPEVMNLNLDTSLESPDGYRFSNSRRHSSGFIPELFVGHNHRNQIVLTKNSARIPLIDSHIYLSPYNTKFLGWVIDRNPGGHNE